MTQMTLFIVLSHCVSSLSSYDKCRPSIKQLPNLQTNPTDLGCESACEPDDAIISRQFCGSCTGCQFRDALTTN